MVAEEYVEAFQRDGAVLLEGVFRQEWIDKLTKGITKNLASPSQYSESLGAPGGEGLYFNDYCNWTRIPEFEEFVWNSQASEIAGSLMQSEYGVFYHEHVLTKDPGSYKVTPWHQDQPYYPIDGHKNCSLWIPVDPVPLESAIEFVRGSHRWGKWFHPKKFATALKYPREGEGSCNKVFLDTPDVDADRDKYDILKWKCKPGDCIAFHMLTLHGAPVNSQAKPRRVVSTRWLGDDTVVAERPWQVSPPITGGLKPGEKVLCELFPLVWTKPKN